MNSFFFPALSFGLPLAAYPLALIGDAVCRRHVASDPWNCK